MENKIKAMLGFQHKQLAIHEDYPWRNEINREMAVIGELLEEVMAEEVDDSLDGKTLYWMEEVLQDMEK